MTVQWKGFKTALLLWAVAAAAVIFDAGVYLLAIKPKGKELSALETEHRKKRAETAAPAEDRGRIDKELKRVYGQIPGWEEFTRVMGEVYRKAESLNLSIDSASYQPAPVKDSDLVRVTVSMPVTGSYGNIKRFIYDLETSRRLFLIENLSLGSGRGKEGDVSLNLALTAHFRG